MNLECTESRKYFQAQPPRRRKFQFRLFLSSLDVFGCVLCRRSFANIAVYFIRRGVDTDTQDRNKEKFPALKGILKSQKKKNILFKLLDLKMKFTQLLHEHFFFFFCFMPILFNSNCEENFKKSLFPPLSLSLY